MSLSGLAAWIKASNKLLPGVALADALIHHTKFYSRECKSDPLRSKVRCFYRTDHLTSSSKQGTQDSIEENLSFYVPRTTTLDEIVASIDSACWQLVHTSNVENVTTYITTNLALQRPPLTDHIKKLLFKYGAIFVRPPVWHSAFLLHRYDLILLLDAGLRHILSVTTELTEHINVTNTLIGETVIDATTDLGRMIAELFIETCFRADIDAIICENLTQNECEDKAANTALKWKQASVPPVFVCIKTAQSWHLVLIRNYDLLFVWLALLFDEKTMFWNTHSSQWGASKDDSPVPTLMNVLLWKEANST
jgi:hypothetical protein